jgi:hypothetical protein
VITFALLQVGWWAAVLGAAHGVPWLGPVVIGVLLAFQLTTAAAPRRELAAVVGLGLAGSVADSLQSGLGLLSFAASPGAWVCPAWIAALWFHFGTALRGPLARWAGSSRWLAIAGAVGAPLAYLPGTGFGVLGFHPDLWPSMLSIAVVWAVLLPVGVRLANRSAAGAALAEVAARRVAGPAASSERPSWSRRDRAEVGDA